MLGCAADAAWAYRSTTPLFLTTCWGTFWGKTPELSRNDALREPITLLQDAMAFPAVSGRTLTYRDTVRPVLSPAMARCNSNAFGPGADEVEYIQS